MSDETLHEHYRRLFASTGYNERTVPRGRRFLDSVKDLLTPPVVDLGCGRGLFVRLAREAGFACDGVDWVEGAADQVADITQPLDLALYRTATAFDVLEHIPADLVNGVLRNLAIPGRFVAIIHNGPSRRWLGRELHVTRMLWPQWRERLEAFLIIEGESVPWPPRGGKRRLFYGRSRP